MGVLYVIGNGFDLSHDLPTKYTDFKQYSENKLPDLERYFDFDLNDDAMWRDFENKLGDFDNRIFFACHCLNDQCESWGEAQGVADDIGEQADSLVGKISEAFQGWIESIDISAVRPVFPLRADAAYITFNYTSVLQDVYKIPSCQINHIHGKVSECEMLVFGHGKEIEEEPELDENGDSTRTMYTDAESAAKYPLHALKKNVLDVIRNNFDWFTGLSRIHTVVVLGHSLNDIDLPYFQKIYTCTGIASWVVSYYSENEKDHHRSQLIKVGIPDERITCFHVNAINPYLP